MTTTMTAVLKIDKTCKGSVRYGFPDNDEFPITSVYVRKPWCTGKKKIKLTVEEVSE